MGRHERGEVTAKFGGAADGQFLDAGDVGVAVRQATALGDGEASQDLSELLVYELTSKQPTLLLPPPAELPRLEQTPAGPRDSPGAPQV